MDPATALTISSGIMNLIAQFAALGIQAMQAQEAGDQAQLDAIHTQVVAASNALAPPGAPVVAVS